MLLRANRQKPGRTFGPWIMTPILAIALLSKCASEQSTQQGDPVQQSAGQQGVQNTSLNAGTSSPDSDALGNGAAMNNAVDEGGSSDNFAGANGEGDNLGGNGENAPANATMTNENASLGASLNNVPVESNGALNASPEAALNPSSNPLNAATTPLNNGVNALGGSNPAANSAGPANAVAQAPANAAATVPAEATPQTVAPVGISDTTSARAAASPFSNPHMNWPGKGKVKYVTRALTRHSAPNGPVLGEFEQGEHPLIFQNGNWVELHDGSFVKGNGLSEKSVGYSKGKKSWQ